MTAKRSITEGFKEVEILQIVEIEGRKAFVWKYEADPEDIYDDDEYRVIDWESGYCMNGWGDYSPDSAIESAIRLCQKYGAEETKKRAEAAIAKNGRANE
jgi:hypothetical protein